MQWKVSSSMRENHNWLLLLLSIISLTIKRNRADIEFSLKEFQIGINIIKKK